MTQSDHEDACTMFGVVEGLGVTASAILCVAKLTISPEFWWIWCLAPAWIPALFVVSATLVMGAIPGEPPKEDPDGR